MPTCAVYFQNVEYEGLTGVVHFDLNGLRTDIKLDLVEKYLGSMQKTGEVGME